MEIILALLIGLGGGWLLHDQSPLDCKDDALIVASCPTLTPLEDSTFGGHILKLQEVGGLYNECRKACVTPHD